MGYLSVSLNAYPYVGTTLSTSFTTGYTGSNGNGSGGSTGDGLVIDGAGNLVYSDGFDSAGSSAGATSFSAYDLNPTLPIQTSGQTPNSNRYGLAFLASIPLNSPATLPYNNRPAVDGAGNLYFSDGSGNRIVEEQYIHGAYNKLLVVATGLSHPGDVVVDGAGAVYAVDAGNNRIVKETPKGDGTYTQTVVDSSFAHPPGGLAIDRIGNLYVSLNTSVLNLPVVKETLANGTYTPSNLPLSVNSGLDVDPAGNVFAVQYGSGINNIQELDVSTPPSFIFAQTAVGSTSSDSPRTVTVTNNGNAPLQFGTNPAITTGFTLSPASTCTQSAALAPGASCTLLINFVPTQSGVTNGTLTLTDNHLANVKSTQVIKLNGQGTGSASISATLSPSTANFGSIAVGASGSQSLTLANTGTASINVGTASLPGTVFKVTGTTCGASLAAGASCTYTVVFTPTAAGTQTATFSITDDAGTQTSALTGNGTQATAPQATLTPASGNFGTITVGATSAATTFTLANAGNASLSITSFGIGGANSSSFVQGVSTCGSTLAAGASCTIAVTFAPTSAGGFSATLSVTDAVGTQSAALTGTGAAAAGVAQAVLTPPSANFGSVTVGSSSAAQTFTFSNPGTASLAITSVTLGGSNASAYTLTSNTCSTSLAAGATCSATITFKPLSAATLTATLVIVDAVGTQSSALTGIGAAAPPPADFTLSASPATQSSYRGTTVSYPVQLGSVSSSNPFTSAVGLTIAGLPSGATAVFSPASVVPGTGSTSTLTVTIPGLYASNTGNGRLVLTGISAATLLLVILPRRRRLPVRLLLALYAFGILSAGAMGCGSGNGFAVPTSTSTLVITGTSGAITHTTSVSLTVQ